MPNQATLPMAGGPAGRVIEPARLRLTARRLLSQLGIGRFRPNLARCGLLLDRHVQLLIFATSARVADGANCFAR
jgi:hypothetical protein